MKSLFTRKSLAVVSALFVASIVTSCHDEEVANIDELSFRHGYETNFVKTFGEINPNQSWDFSSYARRKANMALTRATVQDFNMELYSDQNKLWYDVPTDLLDAIFVYVNEENGMANNKDRIDPKYWHAFSFEATNSDAFDLLPMYLGASQSKYRFFMVVVDPDTKETLYDGELWDLNKDTHMQWTANFKNWQDITGSNGSGGHGSTMQAKGVRSNPILIDFSDSKYGLTVPDKKYTVYFYLYIDVEHPQINEPGNVLTSITHTPNIVAIDLPVTIDALTNNGNYNAMVFGCETGNAEVVGNGNDGRADFDYNDLMFLLVGRIPDIYYDEMLQTTTIKKRYMIEDLTGFDFDFNDIVVDLTDVSVHHYKIDEGNGIKEEEPIEYNGVSYPTVKQDAAFVYCCGTLPFQVKIGEKEFNKVTDPTDADNTYKQLSGSSDADNTKVTQLGSSTGIEPGYVYTYTYSYTEDDPTPSPFWDPVTNNISATIWTERDLNGSTDASDGVDGPWAWVSRFPDTGDVPYIIATDQGVNWSPELKHISLSWLGGDMSTDGSYVVTVSPITTTTNP